MAKICKYCNEVVFGNYLVCEPHYIKIKTNQLNKKDLKKLRQERLSLDKTKFKEPNLKVGGKIKLEKLYKELGYVYIMLNTSFKGWCKIGVTSNPKGRLQSYQTGSPFKNYFFHFTVKTEKFRFIESTILKELKLTHKVENEWIFIEPSKLENSIKNYL